MKEKVYSIDNYWDMNIFEGMADYNGRPVYYENIFSVDLDDWTDEYLLIPLPEDIFNLGKAIWDYWRNWIKTENSTNIPHPACYTKLRSCMSFEEMVANKNSCKEWQKAEQNYQNQLSFENYLKNNISVFKAKGFFTGQIDGTDTFVEWRKGRITEDAVNILQSSDIESATKMLLYLCFSFNDCAQVQNVCLLLIKDPKIHNDVRRLAITCLGHLARLHSTLNTAKVVPFLQRQKLYSKHLTGTIDDALQDIELFVKK